VADFIARSSFWLGVYPGLTPRKLGYVIDSLQGFVAERLAARSQSLPRAAGGAA
jgi:hypothetical protein